jgi:trehalose 6-phosphate phosphatase
MPPTDAPLEALLEPLRRAPRRSAVLLDVDGVLAPIVAQPEDAHMP